MPVDSLSFKAGEILTFQLACHQPALLSHSDLPSLACLHANGEWRVACKAAILRMQNAVKSESISDLSVQLNSFFQSIISP